MGTRLKWGPTLIRVASNSSDVSADSAVWVVRGGPKGETVAHNLNQDVVTLGYGNWITDAAAFGAADRDSLDRMIEQGWGNEPERRRRRGRNEILRFRDSVRTGDLVVLPLKNHESEPGSIAIGTVIERAEFDPDQPLDARLRRPVRWLAKEVPPSELRSDLRKALRGRWAVFEPNVEDAAWRIRRLADHRPDPGRRRQDLALSGDEAGVASAGGREIPEGAKTRVMVNRYERDPDARERCLDHFGHECQVCRLRFEDRYGEIGRDFIHVHHKTPLSEIADHESHTVNPVEDLVPVCPNCHAMLHRGPEGATLTVDELRREMRGSK